MFKTLRQLFAQFEEQPTQEISAQLALAVLLYEVASADNRVDLDEQSIISKVLSVSFELSDDGVEQLLMRARTEQQESISIQTYTAVLTKNLDREQRIEFIQAMWQVAYADGELDGHEEYIIRKIADLIYLSHSDYIKAKLQVSQAQ